MFRFKGIPPHVATSGDSFLSWYAGLEHFVLLPCTLSFAPYSSPTFDTDSLCFAASVLGMSFP